MELDGKIVFVSGSNRGIGKALVEALLKRGVAKIYAAARDIEQIPDFGDARVVKIPLDITDTAQVCAAARAAADVDVLINNAGVLDMNSAFEGPFDMVRRDMEVNYFGTLSMMREFIPVLEGKDAATILNVASIASFVNFPFIGGYSASKAALYSITQGARIELAAKNIAVHSVNPGPINTDMAKDVHTGETTPGEAAENILDGLANDVADIFPDNAGREMFDVWKKDYRELEAMVAGTAAENSSD